MVVVHDTVYYDAIYEFGLHSFPISSICVYSDRFVFSNCMDGKVFHWEIRDRDSPSGRLEKADSASKEHYSQCFGHESAKPYSSFVYDEERDLFVACLPEKNLVVYQNKARDLMFEYFNQEFSYTALCHVPKSKALLCGTSRGSICVHLWPPVFAEKELRKFRQLQVFREVEFYEFQPLLFPVSHMMLTPGDKHLVVGSTDGAMTVLRVDSKEKEDDEEPKVQIDNKGGITNTANDLFLVKNSQIRQQLRAIREKEMEVARYEKKKATDAENRERDHRARLLKIEKLFEQSKSSSEEHKNRFLNHSKEQISVQTRKKQELLQMLEQKAEELTQETKEAVEYEVMRNQELKAEFEKMKEDRKKQLEELAREQLQTQDKLKGKFESNIRELDENHKRVVEDASRYGTVARAHAGVPEQDRQPREGAGERARQGRHQARAGPQPGDRRVQQALHGVRGAEQRERQEQKRGRRAAEALRAGVHQEHEAAGREGQDRGRPAQNPGAAARARTGGLQQG